MNLVLVILDRFKAFFAMVCWMLAFKPRDRPTAKEVLETEWIRCKGLGGSGRCPSTYSNMRHTDYDVYEHLGKHEHEQSVRI